MNRYRTSHYKIPVFSIKIKIIKSIASHLSLNIEIVSNSFVLSFNGPHQYLSPGYVIRSIILFSIKCLVIFLPFVICHVPLDFTRVGKGIFADSEGGHTLHAREAVMEP